MRIILSFILLLFYFLRLCYCFSLFHVVNYFCAVVPISVRCVQSRKSKQPTFIPYHIFFRASLFLSCRIYFFGCTQFCFSFIPFSWHHNFILKPRRYVRTSKRAPNIIYSQQYKRTIAIFLMMLPASLLFFLSRNAHTVYFWEIEFQ